MSIGEDLQAVFGEALAFLYDPATLYAPSTTKVSDGAGGFIYGPPTEYPCLAREDDFSDMARATGVPAEKSKVFILATSLQASGLMSEPQSQWTLKFTGKAKTWTIGAVRRDPVEAAYICEVS